MTVFYSDREFGLRPRTETTINQIVWGGIFAVVESKIDCGAFGLSFPDRCQDGGIIGTDKGNFYLNCRSLIPDLELPLSPIEQPREIEIFDLIEFCCEHVAKPIQGKFHKFFEHHHLTFDQSEGRILFIQEINEIFSRNGIAYKLSAEGQIHRIINPITQNLIQNFNFNTGDSDLDQLIELAIEKFLDKNPITRKESLEKLWDAFERIKTVINPADKKKSIEALINKCSSEPNFAKILENEASALTVIGNNFRIRHHETDRIDIIDYVQVEYLFNRLFSLISLFAKKINS